MPDLITIRVNGRSVQTTASTSVAAALIGAGITVFRRSVSGAPRGPLCGMGVCFECRVTIDGIPHLLACQTFCRAGMEIVTDES